MPKRRLKCIDIEIEAQATVKSDNNFRRLHFILSHVISSLIAQWLSRNTTRPLSVKCHKDWSEGVEIDPIMYWQSNRNWGLRFHFSGFRHISTSGLGSSSHPRRHLLYWRPHVLPTLSRPFLRT